MENEERWVCLGRSMMRVDRGSTGRRRVARYEAGEWQIEVFSYQTRGTVRRPKFAIHARHTTFDHDIRRDGFHSQTAAMEAVRQRIDFLEGIGRPLLEGPKSAEERRRLTTTRRRPRR